MTTLIMPVFEIIHYLHYITDDWQVPWEKLAVCHEIFRSHFQALYQHQLFFGIVVYAYIVAENHA